ncbi:imidazole glycerol phosphate synthase subunit HisH [Roseateles sp.]|uniref:imidazole glycerol phosphate synthase subunit HisH n=1 Tax=Roseateles sp. TaxID=1971397 RepID=UPI002E06FD4F|nr:imidazole glycerol phosphate synthase subunit HisH [Roseateles sp.]HEV6966456.1 imidazole glycerol phosphate synthase subunit HisH [Roseateles sp.]
MSNAVSIVDYGVGNINSVANMLKRAGAEVTLVRSPVEVLAARRLVLPGVGAFDSCRTGLDSIAGLEDAIRTFIGMGRPMLGICVGMQLLATESEEGVLPGLNIIPGKVKRFVFDNSASKLHLKVPHMGWSSVTPAALSPLFGGGLSELNRFYFVHSYYFSAADETDVAAWCDYGGPFAASVRKGNVYGAQFHPEKSHRFGLQMFRNFIHIT